MLLFRGEDAPSDGAAMPARCQVRSRTKSPCPRRAVVEVRGVTFCGPCAREQEAYFAIGELVARDESRGRGGRALAEALKRMRQERAGGTEGLAAEARRGPSGAYKTAPFSLRSGQTSEI